MKTLKLFGVLFCAVAIFTSCEEQVGLDPTGEQTKSVYETIAENPDFSTLVSLVERVEMTAIFTNTSDLTVFAPTNQAFEKLGKDLTQMPDEELKEIILYHVLGQKVEAAQIQQGQTYVSTETYTAPQDFQLSMLVEKQAELVKLNKTISVVTPDIQAANGVIHAINEVALPMDVLRHAEANEYFVELVDFIYEAEMVYSLQQEEELFTLFAPWSQAFEAIKEMSAEWTPEEREDILSYHIIQGENIRFSELLDGQELTAINGRSFQVSRENNVVTLTDELQNQISFEVVDIQATNGVLHMVTKVMLPQQ